MTVIIKTHNLTKKYGTITALRQISFTVTKGTLFGLLGPNGSGKTTIIKILTGQIKPTSGSAMVMNLSVEENPITIREKVGIIPEQETPPSFLTAMEYLDLVGDIRKIKDIKARADWWFDFLDFADKKDVLCKDLSRGTRQKLMLSQAFIHQPTLALIDEPLINFDPIMQRKVKDFFVRYVSEGNTLFISTHILSIAEEICSECAIIHKGILRHISPVQEIIESGMHLDEYFLHLINTDCHE